MIQGFAAMAEGTCGLEGITVGVAAAAVLDNWDFLVYKFSQ
jgi:hypothetical protein